MLKMWDVSRDKSSEKEYGKLQLNSIEISNCFESEDLHSLVCFNIFWVRVRVLYCNFELYFSYIMAVNYWCRNRSTRIKPLTAASH
jgi:hypothetical protein